MRPGTKLVAALTLLAAIALNGQKGDPARVMFEAARKKEVVDGDPKGAIEQYKKIAEGKDRALSAHALLHMADAYRKLGDSEAQRIYRRVVDEYPEQKETVALAQERLGNSSGPSVTSFRKVWSADWPVDASMDGRYVAHLAVPGGTALFLHDLSTGADRVVVGPEVDPVGTITTAKISRDGRRAAYDWCTGSGRNIRCELRVADVQSPGIAKPRTFFENEDVRFPYPLDWSPDGRSVAVQLNRQDRSSQIGFVSVQDGSLRVLASLDGDGSNAFFSPDGRWLAFDKVAGPNSSQHDVFIIAVDGTREIPAVVHRSHDEVVGWSPDGALLFTSNRNGGSIDLWSIGFREGQVQGSVDFIQRAIGSPLRVTSSGALFATSASGDRDIEIASIDLATGKQLATPIRPIDSFIGTNYEPTWSPDGALLAYVSWREGAPPLIAIRSEKTGDVQELHPQPELTWIRSLRWAPDGHSFIVIGEDLKGSGGIFRVDVQSEAASLIREGVGRYGGLSWSPDATIYFRAGPVFEHDLLTGAERRVPLPRPHGPISLSPDGRWIAVGTPSSIVLVPVAGGEPRELLRLTPEEMLSNAAMSWTRDGRAVIVRKFVRATNAEKSDACCKDELWLVSTVGDPPLKLDIDTSRLELGTGTMMDVHPDGRRLAYRGGGDDKPEVWVLENFLPALKSSK